MAAKLRKPVKRKPPDPAKAWAKRLARTRPGLVPFVLDALATRYGQHVWTQVHEPTSELVLTILSQNSADVNAEHAFEGLRARYPGVVSGPGVEATAGADARSDGRINRPGWGGIGLMAAVAEPDWAAVEHAPIDRRDPLRRPGAAEGAAHPVGAAHHPRAAG